MTGARSEERSGSSYLCREPFVASSKLFDHRPLHPDVLLRLLQRLLQLKRSRGFFGGDLLRFLDRIFMLSNKPASKDQRFVEVWAVVRTKRSHAWRWSRTLRKTFSSSFIPAF